MSGPETPGDAGMTGTRGTPEAPGGPGSGTRPSDVVARFGPLPAPVTATVDFFENISPAAVGRIPMLYADDAFFKDPFSAVRGHAAISRIFLRMFEQVRDPRFVVTDAVAAGDRAFLEWEFRFAFRHAPTRAQCIRGATRLDYGTDGRVLSHRDYWDAAEELYEKLPGLGILMRWLKRRAG